jgi:hypothetical protein
LDARKYDSCIDKAQQILQADPQNYFASVSYRFSYHI